MLLKYGFIPHFTKQKIKAQEVKVGDRVKSTEYRAVPKKSTQNSEGNWPIMCSKILILCPGKG